MGQNIELFWVFEEEILIFYHCLHIVFLPFPLLSADIKRVQMCVKVLEYERENKSIELLFHPVFYTVMLSRPLTIANKESSSCLLCSSTDVCIFHLVQMFQCNSWHRIAHHCCSSMHVCMYMYLHIIITLTGWSQILVIESPNTPSPLLPLCFVHCILPHRSTLGSPGYQ